MVGNQPTKLVYGEDGDSFWEKYPVLETFMHAADSARGGRCYSIILRTWFKRFVTIVSVIFLQYLPGFLLVAFNVWLVERIYA